MIKGTDPLCLSGKCILGAEVVWDDFTAEKRLSEDLACVRNEKHRISPSSQQGEGCFRQKNSGGQRKAEIVD